MLDVSHRAIGKRISICRRRARMTQAKLAEEVNLSPQFIGMVERGERTVSVDLLISVCYVLDVPMEYMLQDSLPESLFKYYTKNGKVFTLREVVDTVRSDLPGAAPPPPPKEPPIDPYKPYFTKPKALRRKRKAPGTIDPTVRATYEYRGAQRAKT